MSKKDEAFGFFSQGKTLDDPEVVSLGLAAKSIKRYYHLWKQLNPEPAVVAFTAPIEVLSEILVEKVPNGGLFEHKGQIYKKHREIYSGQIIVQLMYKAHYTDVFQPTGESVYLSSDVMVTPR